MENETTEDKQMADEKLVYSVDEVAQRLSISRNLAYRLARQKALPGIIHVGHRRMVVSKIAMQKALENGWTPPQESK